MWVVLCVSVMQCHGLWDNKEVEMPDFFKKMKRKVEKKRMTGDRNSCKEKPGRRLRFLPLQASTTSIFCRRNTDKPSESSGEYNINIEPPLDQSSIGSSHVLFAVCPFIASILFPFTLNGAVVVVVGGEGGSPLKLNSPTLAFLFFLLKR